MYVSYCKNHKLCPYLNSVNVHYIYISQDSALCKAPEKGENTKIKMPWKSERLRDNIF